VNPKPTGKKLSILEKLYDPALVLQTIILVFFGIARSAEQNFLPLLAEKYDVAALLSIYYIVQTAVSFVAKFLTGRIYDKRGHAWAIIPGAICLGICYFFMAIADNFWLLMVAAFFSGTGMGALLPGMQTWTVTSVAADRRSTASAVYYNFYDIGQGVGAAALGLIAVNLGYKITFRLAIIPIAVFLVIYLIGTRIQKAKASK
jgi:MFS family permease